MHKRHINNSVIIINNFVYKIQINSLNNINYEDH